MSDKHKNGNPPPSKFCSLRVEKCDPHKNTYMKYDEPKPPWQKYPQAQREYDQEGKRDREDREKAEGHKFPAYVKIKMKTKVTQRMKKWAQHVMSTERVWKEHEAHHCVCCSSVQEFIADTFIKPIIDQTDWCVNQEANIVALPLWGHTFIWYCTPTGEVRDIEQVEEKLGEPRFKDRVMHNCDHDIYQKDELEPLLERIAKRVQKNTMNHKECAKQLADVLNKLVKKFSDRVKDRGKRGGGTHAAWKAGLKGNKNTWYLPFSMARKPRTRAFPLPGATGENLLKVKEYSGAYFGIK